MDYVEELVTTVEESARMLRALPPGDAARHPAPGKWSPKEIIGHLIDSAANNHHRFLRARWQEDLVFGGYEQEAWVAAQRYQDAPWDELLTLWRAYNLHLARVMRLVPETVRTREHRRHNLDRIAWHPVPADRPATLDYFMRDYVGHLRHHLAQIESAIESSRERETAVG